MYRVPLASGSSPARRLHCSEGKISEASRAWRMTTNSASVMPLRTWKSLFRAAFTVLMNRSARPTGW